MQLLNLRSSSRLFSSQNDAANESNSAASTLADRSSQEQEVVFSAKDIEESVQSILDSGANGERATAEVKSSSQSREGGPSNALSSMSPVFRREFEAINSLEQVDAFFQLNRSTLSLRQAVLLLKKMNFLWNEMVYSAGKIRNVKSASARANQQKLDEMNPKVEAIQSAIIIDCLSQKGSLDGPAVANFLQSVANSQIAETSSRSLIKPEDLIEFELIVSNTLNEHVQYSDIASTLASLIKLGHLPNNVLSKLLEQENLTQITVDGSFILLRQLVHSEVTSMPELNAKLWDRIESSQRRHFNRRLASLVGIVNQQYKLMPADQDDSVARMQRLIDKYANSVAAASSQERMHMEILWTMMNVSEFADSIDCELRVAYFFKKTGEEFFKQAKHISPAHIKRALGFLEHRPAERTVFVQQFIATLRADKFDIKQLNFAELADLMQLVAENQPQDLSAFQKYLNQALSFDLWDQRVLADNFNKMTDLVNTLALHGLLQDDQLMCKYLILLRNCIARDARQGADSADKSDKQLYSKLISTIWTLVYRDVVLESEGTSVRRIKNPIVPKMLEQLYDYSRSWPLTNLEYLQLFQIADWVDNEVADERLPDIMRECIPENLRKVASERFADYDKPFFADEQTEIAKMLLKLRVTFQENKRVSSMYRADLLFLEENASIVLHSSSQDQQSAALRKQGGIVGIDKLRHKWFTTSDSATTNGRVMFIDTKMWESKSDQQKYASLSTMLGQKQHSMSSLFA